jgi:hypothetical protein
MACRGTTFFTLLTNLDFLAIFDELIATIIRSCLLECDVVYEPDDVINEV